MTNWTPEQAAFIAAVKDTTESLRLDAVAGSGKTTTLLHAARGLDPKLSIIALAFNKNIADELGKKFPSYVTCKTLNGVGHGVWAKHQGRKNLDSRKMADLTSKYCEQHLTKEENNEVMWNAIRTVVTRIKANGLVPMEWQDRLHRPAPILEVEHVEAILEAHDMGELNPSFIFTAARDIVLTSISEAYVSRIDFDDQIYMSTYFAPDECWPKHDVVMVDEAQDLSTVQHDMIERLGASSRLIVVGDERQAIYGWRGASCHSLSELTQRFGLRKMPLTVSFRCPEAVIKEAQAIVPYIKAVKPGGEVLRLQSQKGEPAWFIEDIQRGSVILCRNNAPLIKTGFALITAGIPCFFTGKDMAAGLKKIVAAQPENVPVLSALANWYQEECDKLARKKKYDAIDRLTDKYEALESIYIGSRATNKTTLIRGIDALFLREPSPGAIELSTIHKSKGKEWKTVYFLNENLLPGKWIVESVSNGTPGAEDLLLQAHNLRYVAVTRALERLIYIYLGKDEQVWTHAEWQEEVNRKEAVNE